jgi:hypothetical protein
LKRESMVSALWLALAKAHYESLPKETDYAPIEFGRRTHIDSSEPATTIDAMNP